MSSESRAQPVLPGNSETPSLRERLLDWRHRMIASPAFQRWSARLPFTRGIAHRKAAALFNIATGYVYSQVLSASVSLNLFELLRDGPRDVADLSRSTGLPPDALRRLLLAACSIELLTQRDEDRFGLGDLGAAVLGNPGVPAMVRHHQYLYRDLTDPLALLKREFEPELARFWPYATGTEGGSSEYSELMAASQSLVADDILDAYPMGQHRELRDIAGGTGNFICSALARSASLRASLIDLPSVAEQANLRLSERGLGERATAVGGDMFDKPLEGAESADLISLVRVVHDHDDGPIMQLFRALKRDMAPGARLLIAEPMAGTRGAEPMGDGYFGLYLWAMGSGRPRSAEELSRMLRDAGFSECREIKTSRPLMTRLLVATP